MSEGDQGGGGDVMIEPDDCDARINKAKDVKDDQHVQMKIHLMAAQKKVDHLTVQADMYMRQRQESTKDNVTLRSKLIASRASLEAMRENTANHGVSEDLIDSDLQVEGLTECLTHAVDDLLKAKERQTTINNELTAKKGKLGDVLNTLETTKRELGIAHIELNTTKNKLAATESYMGTTHNDLKTAHTQLATAQTGLKTTQNDLRTTITELSTAQNELSTAKENMASLQAEIDAFLHSMGMSNRGVTFELGVENRDSIHVSNSDSDSDADENNSDEDKGQILPRILRFMRNIGRR